MQLEAHHVGIIVSDLARSQGVLRSARLRDADRARRRDEDDYCFLELGGFKLELFAYREAPPAVACEGRAIGFRHLALRTEDMAGTVEELRAASIVGLDTEPHEIPGLARLMFFRDFRWHRVENNSRPRSVGRGRSNTCGAGRREVGALPRVRGPVLLLYLAHDENGAYIGDGWLPEYIRALERTADREWRARISRRPDGCGRGRGRAASRPAAKPPTDSGGRRVSRLAA